MADEESANDPQFLGLLKLGWETTVLVVRPVGFVLGNAVYYTTFGLVFLLQLLWRPLEFLLLPFLYLGEFVLRCILAPFRFLAKFETLYIYLGIAALIGLAGGLVVSIIGGVLQGMLGLDANSEPKGRTAKDYRKARRKRDATGDTSTIPSSPVDFSNFWDNTQAHKTKARPGASKASKPPTILEELDSDD